MHEIEMHEMTQDFFTCWQAAGNHLNCQVDGGIGGWLRAHPHPPFLEHLSFRLGNQLFFIRVEDVDGKVTGPGNPAGFREAARMAKGHACRLPMKKVTTGCWVADWPGWGLLDAATGKPLDPVSMVSGEKIEMTTWEVHDFAVQVVRFHLEERGFQLMSWQGDPGVDPSIWFVGSSGGPEWVVVRPALFPSTRTDRPDNWNSIAESCARMSSTGHFASVAIASAEQDLGAIGEPVLPLWRGHALEVEFDGLDGSADSSG